MAHKDVMVAHRDVTVAHRDVVVALQGCSVGSLVAIPDCRAAVLDSNLAIFAVYSGLPVLRWTAIWDGFLL